MTMKKAISAFIITMLIILVSVNAFAAEKLQFMSTGNDVFTLKQQLVALGYLDKSNLSNNIYDANTMNAVKEIQRAFELDENGIASPEIQVIIRLMLNMTNISVAAITPTPNPTSTPAPAIPNLKGLKESEAETTVRKYGYIPVVKYEYNENYDQGIVCNYTSPAAGRVQITVSKGASYIESKNSTYYVWWLDGSQGDDYDLYNPYIIEDTLYIELDATINTNIHYYHRGYGTACINDTFDKAVPIIVRYENEQIKKGEKQSIVLEIPISDLNVQKPTTLSVKIELYKGDRKITEDRIRMDFTIAW